MCSGKDFDPTSEGSLTNPSSYDPTSSEGLVNLGGLGIGGLGGGLGGITTGIGDKLGEGWDTLTGKDAEDAAKQAVKDAAQAQMAQLDFLREQYGDLTAALDPYREAGQEFLGPLTDLLQPEAKQEFISNYLQGDEYQQLQDQASQQLLQSAAATGGLGASGTQDRLARQTLQMGNQLGGQAYNQAIGNLTQGTNIGLGTFGTQLQAQGQLNQGVNQGLGNIANLSIGGAQIGQGGILGQLAPFAPVVGALI